MPAGSTDVIEKLKPRGRQPSRYKNTGVQNVFTTVGCCRPGQSIQLKAAEAKKYADLQKV